MDTRPDIVCKTIIMLNGCLIQNAINPIDSTRRLRAATASTTSTEFNAHSRLTRRLCLISNSYLRIACDSTIDQCLHNILTHTIDIHCPISQCTVRPIRMREIDKIGSRIAIMCVCLARCSQSDEFRCKNSTWRLATTSCD